MAVTVATSTDKNAAIHRRTHRHDEPRVDGLDVASAAWVGDSELHGRHRLLRLKRNSGSLAAFSPARAGRRGGRAHHLPVRGRRAEDRWREDEARVGQTGSNVPDSTYGGGTVASAEPGPGCAHRNTVAPSSAPAAPIGRCAVTTPVSGAAVKSGPEGTSPAARTIAQASSAPNPTTSGTSVTGRSLCTSKV